MSQENLDLARRNVKAFVGLDWDVMAEILDPDVEWEETPGLGPDASVYRGLDEVRAAVESWQAMWSDYTFEVRDLIDAGEQVVVLAEERGDGRASGVGVERELGFTLTFRGDRVVRVRLYGTWDEAREAAGLSE